MPWTAEKIKSLRRRLGWSSSDLARRLHVESTEVVDWESGMNLPVAWVADQLSLLEKQAEANSESMAQEPLAEVFLEEQHTDQCDLAAVKRRFSENN